MSLDPYASCPCGSGKKFKWCCQLVYAGIQHAWQLERNGQHEMATKTMEQVVQQHGGNPEAWGQKALLAAVHEQPAQAEEALDKAFALNPNYPFGLKLRAEMRFGEGEVLGALALARKAVEAYDPDAREALGDLHGLIFETEMRCQRPIAARAALARAAHLAPANEQIRDALQQVFGPQGRFPPTATKNFEFKKPAAGVSGARRQAWDRALSSATPRLTALAGAFLELTKEDPADAAAHFNLGLSRAWLGDHASALTAFDRYVELETDEAAAVEAATLMEILRFGHGMEEQCDYREYNASHQIRRPEPLQALLQEWVDSRRLIALPTQQENTLTAVVLELSTAGVVTVGRPAADVGRFAAMLLISGSYLQLTSVVKDRFDRVRDEVRDKLGLGLGELRTVPRPPQFSDVHNEVLVFPMASMDDAAMGQKIIEYTTRFYEDTWIHRPLRSLNNIRVVDAAAHPKLRRKVLGLIRFLEECARSTPTAGYSFDSLRRKLGLLTSAPSAAPSAASDVGAMGAAELAKLDVAALAEEELEKAYQTAYRLDAQELAKHFATALVARPTQPGRTDRYPWFAYLIQSALRDGEAQAALDHVNEGQKIDCEHNEGKRRNDYELFRAQVQARSGETESAVETYQRLIERVPRDFKVRGKAAEAMLALKEPGRALRFAEDGVKAAREANDRGSEEYLLELAAAARKQGA